MNGQDPVRNREKFTPRVNPLYFKWPTNEEAETWAALGRSRSRSISIGQDEASAASVRSPSRLISDGGGSLAEDGSSGN